MTSYRSLRALRDQARQIQPDPAWKVRARNTLLMQVRNAMPTGDLAKRERESLVSVLLNRTVEAMRGPVMAIIGVIAVVLGGSIASVSASEQALPGDVLYPVKLATEQARIVFTTESSAKVRLKSEFTVRRADEFKTIVTQDNPDKDKRVARAADVLKSDLDTLRRQLSAVTEKEGSTEAAAAAQVVDKSVVEVAKTLNATTLELSPETQEKVDAAKAQAVDVGIQALEVLVTSKTVDGQNVVSETDIGASVAAHTALAQQTVASAKVVATSSSTAMAFVMTNSSTTKAVATSTSALQIVQDAEASLATLQALVGENQLDQVVIVLKDVTQKSFTVQKQVGTTGTATATTSTTSTVPVVETSTSASGTVTGSITPPSSTPPVPLP